MAPGFVGKDARELEALLERIKQVAVMDPQPEIHLRADKATRYERLAQVIANLLMNAARYTPAGAALGNGTTAQVSASSALDTQMKNTSSDGSSRDTQPQITPEPSHIIQI